MSETTDKMWLRSVGFNSMISISFLSWITVLRLRVRMVLIPGRCGSGDWAPACEPKGRRVWFPVRAHAWVVGQVPSRGRVQGNHTLMFLSLSFSLPSPLSKNKINKIFFKKTANLKKKTMAFSPDKCGSVGWASCHKAKDRWFTGSIPGQGTLLGWGFSPWLGHKQEATNHLSHRCFSPSLFPSLPLSLKINK